MLPLHYSRRHRPSSEFERVEVYYHEIPKNYKMSVYRRNWGDEKPAHISTVNFAERALRSSAVPKWLLSCEIFADQ